MQITLELPDDVGPQAQVKDLPRALLKSFRPRRLSLRYAGEEQVRRLLGFETRMEVHGFLKDHGVYLNYNREDLEHDMQTLRRLRDEEPACG